LAPAAAFGEHLASPPPPLSPADAAAAAAVAGSADSVVVTVSCFFHFVRLFWNQIFTCWQDEGSL